jgi:hypothetical protein
MSRTEVVAQGILGGEEAAVPVRSLPVVPKEA